MKRKGNLKLLVLLLILSLTWTLPYPQAVKAQDSEPQVEEHEAQTVEDVQNSEPEAEANPVDGALEASPDRETVRLAEDQATEVNSNPEAPVLARRSKIKQEVVEEAYIDIEVSKEWDDQSNKYKKRPSSVKVWLYANGVKSKALVLDKANNWKSSFENLPVCDEHNQIITYEIKEESISGYSSSISKISEEKQLYWVMLNGIADIRSDRRYVLAAQDWGQAMYFGNPNTYYFLKASDEGERIGLKRLEKTDELFWGRKSGHSSDTLTFGSKTYDEYLKPSNEITKAIDSSQIWLSAEIENGQWTLQNEGNSLFMTLRGENHWWTNPPHFYTYVSSDKNGWDGSNSTNYAQNLSFTNANDGMVKIHSWQLWGRPDAFRVPVSESNEVALPEQPAERALYQDADQYLYLDLTAEHQWTAATANMNHAGQFKFFTPISKINRSYLIKNTPGTVTVPYIPPTTPTLKVPQPTVSEPTLSLEQPQPKKLPETGENQTGLIFLPFAALAAGILISLRKKLI